MQHQRERAEPRIRHSRRDFLRFTGIAGAGAVLAACAGVAPQAPTEGGEPAAAKEGVWVWSFPRTQDDIANIFDPLNEKFHAENADIEVSVEILPWGGRREKMLTAYAGGENPDIAMMQNDMLSLMGLNGVLTPLQDLITPERLSEVPERSTAGVSWNGELVLMPFAFSMDTFLWNKGLAKEVGWTSEEPPLTWDDIRALGPLAVANDVFAWSHNNWGWSRWVELTWQAGGTVYNDEITKPMLTEDSGVETMSFLVEMFQNEWIPKEGNVGSAEEAGGVQLNYFFTGQQVVSPNDDVDIIRAVAEEVPDMEWGMVPPMKNKDFGVLASIDAWGLFNNSESLAAAGKWIDFMVRPENEGYFSSQSGIAPASDPAGEYWEVEEDLKEFALMYLPYARSNQDTSWYWQEGKVVVAPQIQAAVLGMKTVEQALEDAQTELQALIDRDMPKREA